MVALLSRLQFKLTLRSFRGDAGKIVGLVLLAIYGVGIIGSMLIGAYFLRYADAILIGQATVFVFTGISLAWPMLMLILGSNEALAPGKFALLPVRAADLQPGMLVALLMTFGGIVTTLLTFGFWLAWSKQGVLFLVAWLASVLALVWTLLCTKTLVTAVSRAMGTRKFRDVASMILVGLIVLMALGTRFLSLGKGAPGFSADTLAALAEVGGWTPFGWAWSIPLELAMQRWWALGLKLVLALVTAILMWWGWALLLDRALTSAFDAGSAATKVKTNSRIEPLVPAGPVGAVAARSLRYWGRDPRRKIQALSLVILPVVFSVPIYAAGDTPELLLLVPLLTVGLVAMSLMAGELSVDGDALWQQIGSGTSGKQDRWGRIVALSWLIVPFITVVMGAALALSGAWWAMIVLVAATVGALGVAFGVGAWAGSVWCYPVPPPSEGAMNSRGNLSAALGLMLATLIEAVLLLPIIGLAVASYWIPAMLIVSPIVSLATGALALWGGVEIAGRYLDRNWPEVLAKITWSKSH